jgi:hypothetical protein
MAVEYHDIIAWIMSVRLIHVEAQSMNTVAGLNSFSTVPAKQW